MVPTQGNVLHARSAVLALDVPPGRDVAAAMAAALDRRGLEPANLVRGTVAVRDQRAADEAVGALRAGWPGGGCNLDVVVQPPADPGTGAAVQAWVAERIRGTPAGGGLAFEFPAARVWTGAVEAPAGGPGDVRRAFDALERQLGEAGLDAAGIAKTWSYLPERPAGAAAAFRAFNDARFGWLARRGLDYPDRWPGGGFPANTGVGAETERLRLACVAAAPVTPLQNPHQRPPHTYDRTFASSPALFSRAVHVPLSERSGVVLIAGTASVHGDSVSGSAAGEQASAIAGLLDALLGVENLRAHGVAAESAGIERLEALTVFVADPAHAGRVRRALVAGGVPDGASMCLLSSRMSRDSMLVEVDGWATVELAA